MPALTTFTKSRICALSLFLILFVAFQFPNATAELKPEQTVPGNIVDLGKVLFFDTNLSQNRTQSCASCHDPERAFTDGRTNHTDGAVSLGDDGISLGDRNAPTISYAALTPAFHKDENGEYTGGLFHDGRAATMVEQAAGPLVNPLEMALPGALAVSERIQENPIYVEAFKKLFNASVFTDAKKVYAAVSQSIATFESSSEFAPFDSKYDRYLRGEYIMTRQEDLGRQFFFSDLINCNSCHLVNLSPLYKQETFTNYRYHNIGTPTNISVRKKNGVDIEHSDQGLLDNPSVNNPIHSGKFKVPTLRNVSVSAPYMHNGVFNDLRTVMLFYSQYMVSNEENQTNPETGKPWGKPEVEENIDLKLLRQRQPLDSYHITALLAFLDTLTDKRYEYLLKK
jgi:cytochrome c peroxidase